MKNQFINPNVCIVTHVRGENEYYIISYKPLGKVDSKMIMWFPEDDKTDATDLNGVEAIEQVKEFLENMDERTRSLL